VRKGKGSLSIVFPGLNKKKKKNREKKKAHESLGHPAYRLQGRIDS